MISKELLSEVLDIEVLSTEIWFSSITTPSKTIIDDKKINIETEEYTFSIGVYTLMHKCKEWAFKNKYNISTLIHYDGKRYGKYYISVLRIDISDSVKTFDKIDTEPEAIFKACEWILKDIDE